MSYRDKYYNLKHMYDEKDALRKALEESKITEKEDEDIRKAIEISEKEAKVRESQIRNENDIMVLIQTINDYNELLRSDLSEDDKSFFIKLKNNVERELNEKLPRYEYDKFTKEVENKTKKLKENEEKRKKQLITLQKEIINIKNNLKLKKDKETLDQITRFLYFKEELMNKINDEIKGGDGIDKFDPIPNEGGGNCLFHSLSHFLRITHQQIRADCVRYISKNRGRFSDFFPNFYYNNIDDYISKMIKDRVWGDEAIILTASLFYNRKIIVLTTVGGHQYTTVYNEESPNINVIYIRCIGNIHFEALKKK